jgi:phosphohistidine phosphatase SixA
VILMRHGSSPRDPPDAAHFDADNATHERQLDELGTESARAMGEAIHWLKIPIGAIFSSSTYRAVQTIKLAQLGSVFIIPDLGDIGQSMQRDQSGTRADSLKSLTAKPPRRGTNTLIVKQSPNITEAFNRDANDLAEGEALIIKPDGVGGAPVVARIKIDEWPKLGRTP